MKLPDINLALAAPCPIGLEINNGWLDRINVIDGLVEKQRRLYLNFAPHHNQEVEQSLRQVSENCYEAYVSSGNKQHSEFINRVTEQVGLVYVHTLHGAEFFTHLLESGKIIVDIHGVTPEEEFMLGHAELVPKYEAIERQVLQSARCCVMVSKAMKTHYEEKYGRIDADTVILPIVQTYEGDTHWKGNSRDAELPVYVVYAGGLQEWQNVSSMLEIARKTTGFANYTFLSNEWKELQQSVKKQKLGNTVHCRFAEKLELSEIYIRSEFGLVLRDDNAVNRVACPTKLFDYLSHGLIPIVRFPQLGDFQDYGYTYIEESEFASGFFPDTVTRKWMRERNLDVVQEMVNDFRQSYQHLGEILRSSAY